MEKGGELVRFSIPFIPPSINSLYGISTKRGRVSVFLKQEGRRFKDNAKMFMPKIEMPEAPVVLELRIVMSHSWICKNGNIKRFDIQNLEKILIDAIAERYGFGDERIWKKECAKEVGDDRIDVRLLRLSDRF